MATYAYRGRTGGGAVTGEIEADDRPAAVALLRGKGIIATSMEERKAKAAAASSFLSFGKQLGGKVKDKDLAIYTRQFSTMIDAGLPIAQCLGILAEQSDSKPLRDVTARIAKDVEGGTTLADSFRKYPKVFNDLFTNMLQVGESGGVLDVVLQRLSAYIEKAAALKRKVKGAMVYPITIMSVAFLVILFSIWSSAPVFSPTLIMWTTIAGKTGVLRSGSASVRPVVTAVRAFMTAASTTRLPADRAVMSNPSRIGTPDARSVPMVRVKRATATFLISVPMTGTFRRIRSMTLLPWSVA